MKRKFTFLMAAFTLLAFLVIPMGMRGQEVTLDFTTNECWEFPTAYTVDETEFTCGDYTITLAGSTGNGYKYNTGYLIIGKSGAYLQLPAFSFDVEKIEVVGRTGASGNVKQNIYVGEEVVSTETTGATGTNTYMINAAYQAAGNIYTLMVTSNHNTQITEIKVYAPSTTPSITINSENIELDAAESEVETISVTYANFGEDRVAAIALYEDAECTTSVNEQDNFWLSVGFATNDDETIEYFAAENEGTEPRTVYMRVEAYDGELVSYYSNVISITQAAPVPLYAVYFELDGGTFVPNEVFTDDIVEVEAGTYALPSATKENFTFNGWNDGTETYAAGANYTVSDDVDFTAQWTENVTPGPGGDEITATLNIENYATANNWSNGTQYSTATVNPVTFTANGGNNTGKYYTNGQEWRFYQNESASITIAVPEGYTLVSINPTYNSQNSGVLKNGSSTIASGTTVSVSGRSVSFTVGNSGSATNGQVRFTNIDVTYVSDGGTPVPSITVNPATAQAFTYVVGNGPSEDQLFEPTGVNLTSNITVTVTENGAFEIISDSYSEYGYTVTTTGDNDGVFVRLKAGLEAGSYTDNLTFSSEGATDVVIALTGTVTTPVVEMTIAEVRAQGTGDVITIGTVTSCVGITGYIQDATAAICVYGAELTIGDEIRVAGTLEDYNGLLEIKNPTFTVLSSGNTIEPALMTIAEINASTNQGWYIRIENATVTTINNKNTTIAQGENSIVVYNITGVEYDVNDVISLNGNIGYHNAIQIANPTNVEVAVAGYAYQYSINGVLGDEQHGTEITLSNGTAVGGLAFAGWTLNPNDVENILAAGSSYELNEGGVVFYAVYSRTVASGNYVRVTETPEDWEGNYLIVSEGYGVAFDGALTNLDAPKNTISIRLNSNGISANYETNAGFFTITPTVGDSVAIKSASGLYIGQNTDANGMLTSTETVYNNAISFGDDTVNIVGKGGAYLRFNKASNQNRFRYYKTSSFIGQQPIQLYKQEGEITTTSSFYTRVFADETATANIELVGPSIIPSGYALTMDDSENSYTLSNNLGADKFVIEDGAELNYYLTIAGTMQKNINACDYNSNNNAGYYLITTPINEFEPTATNGFITTNYDLYAYDATQDLEWRNYKNDEFSSLAYGKGYLYASGENTTLQFAGTLNGIMNDPNAALYEDLAYNADNDLKSLTLVGNPHTWAESFVMSGGATNFLSLNEAGNGFIVTNATAFTAQPLQGFFVQATAENQHVAEENGAPSGVGGDPESFLASPSNINIKVNQNNSLLDNAIVSFGNGSMLRKLYVSNNSTRVYIPQGNQDYAAVRSANEGEMPVCFKASESGTYTLSINAENVELNYLHLFDNMTGADVDLLATSSYTFEASTTDYANRFRLVFNANNVNENASETFAYNNGSAWVISNQGEATLQVVDVTGRILKSESINGCATISLDQVPGVYMMRLISGNDVKVQKVIIK